jgi:hypothetical protein
MVDKSSMVERLWRNNWLNIRNATEVAKTRNPCKMFIGIELANTVINNNNGSIYPFVSETLNYINSGQFYHIVITTYLDDEYVNKLLKICSFKVDWVNYNPCFQTSKPYFDCYIDAAAGFHPGEWLYVLEMIKISERHLKDDSKIKLKI